MKVLVIIVTYNFCPWLQQCLSSIDGKKYDVMVIDNASTDETITEIKRRYSHILVYASKQNKGFGQANNIGLVYALQYGYDYVFLLNQDAWLLPDTIEKLITIQQKNPDFWVISPMQYNSVQNGLEQQFEVYCRRFKVPIDCPDILSPVEFVNAAAWLVSRQGIETIGGFDPLFPHYGEDTDYLQRVLFFGGKVGIYTSAIAYHERINAKIVDTEKLVYKTCLMYQNMVKNINISLPIALIKMCGYSFWHIIKLCIKRQYREVVVNIKALKHTINNMQNIKEHRRLSMCKGAFLQNNENYNIEKVR